MIKRNCNPKEEPVELFEIISDVYTAEKPGKKEKETARKAAVRLRRVLSENKAGYWAITKNYPNMRQPDVDRLVTIATKIAPNPSCGKLTKRSSRKNPITTMNRTGEVTVKHNGNKVIFDGVDAKSVINLIKNKYPDNSELQNVLG